ncbi:MAG: UbiA family prenyltransferase [Candidatus Andersenbacteria bacterium]
MSKKTSDVPLCIDLDGTLTYTDTLVESFIMWLKKDPLSALAAFLTLYKGRARFKRKVAKHAHINSALLPYNEELIAWLQQQKKKGRKLIVTTASDVLIGRAVAAHLGFIDESLGSDGQQNLAGLEKSKTLVQRFGEKGFDYVGNSRADLQVWPHARNSIVVNASPTVRRQAEQQATVTKQFLRQTNNFDIRVFLQEIRIHQWVKNLLLFVPVITAHMAGSSSAIISTTLAFVAFSLTASSVYLLNDLMDLESDRQHLTKRHRPLAAGRLSIDIAIIALFLMPFLGFLLSLFLPWSFLGLLALYIIINIAYSFTLKGIPFIDVIVLTSLYVLRILAGSAASSIPTSVWLFIFAGFVFLSLALVKRSSELFNLERQGKTKSTGRGYWVHHRTLLSNIGIGSSVLSLIVLGFYTTSPAVTQLYTTPLLLLLLILIFGIWLARIWRFTLHGSMNEDPIVFAAHDIMSYATAATALVILFFAI